MLEVHADVQKWYQGRQVLAAKVKVSSGRLYVVLGPNGSGKSTLLRLFSLIESPDQGSVVYRGNGKVIEKDLMLRQRIVLVPNRRGLFNDTVYNNVSYGLGLRKIKRGTREAALNDAIKKVGLWDLRKKNALSLSDGEAQRLCLAMAMALDPEVILLDEPTSFLDPYNAALVEDLIQSMQGPDTLILLVTHNIFQAKRLSEEVIFLFQGKVVEKTVASKFFLQTESDLAARFVRGEMIY